MSGSFQTAACKREASKGKYKLRRMDSERFQPLSAASRLFPLSMPHEAHTVQIAWIQLQSLIIACIGRRILTQHSEDLGSSGANFFKCAQCFRVIAFLQAQTRRGDKHPNWDFVGAVCTEMFVTAA